MKASTNIFLILAVFMVLLACSEFRSEPAPGEETSSSVSFRACPAQYPLVAYCNDSTITCRSQSEIDAAFQDFLNVRLYAGGGEPSYAEMKTYAQAPTGCGQTVTVTYTVTDACGTTEGCSADFVVFASDLDALDTQVRNILTGTGITQNGAISVWNNTIKAIKSGNNTQACALLQQLVRESDGDPSPPDIVSGEDLFIFQAAVQLLLNQNNCN